jgi:hypothetical protein
VATRVRSLTAAPSRCSWPWTLRSKTDWLVNKSAGQPPFYSVTGGGFDGSQPAFAARPAQPLLTLLSPNPCHFAPPSPAACSPALAAVGRAGPLDSGEKGCCSCVARAQSEGEPSQSRYITVAVQTGGCVGVMDAKKEERTRLRRSIGSCKGGQ